MKEKPISRRAFFETAYGLLKAITFTLAARGVQSGTAAGLFFPDRAIFDNPVFYKKLILGHGEKERKRVVGFGDSNMGDWNDKNWPRLLTVLDQELRERGIGNWETHTFSWNGATSVGVLQQIEANRDFLNNAHGRFDAWMNVGGNDVAGAVLIDRAKAGELDDLFTNPYSPKTLELLDQFSQNIATFGESFRGMLDTLVATYPDKLQNLVVMTVPDLSHCEALRTEEPRVLLEGWSPRAIALRQAIRGAAMGINSQIVREIELFAKKYPQYPIIAVNTWGTRREHFLRDIHYSHLGHKRIVDNVISRMEIGKGE